MLKNLTIEDRGDSLLEVVISAVIMGIIGVLLVTSIATARPFADKMSLVGQTVQNLNTLAESINLQPFKPCTPANAQPYDFADFPSVPASSANGFDFATTSLHPMMTSTSTRASQYSQALALNVPSTGVTWSVEPNLPAGITLDSNTGLLSGSTTQAITSRYIFKATNGVDKATTTLDLTSAMVVVLVNNGTTWVPCESNPVAVVSRATGDGKNATYTYTGKQLSQGQVISVWGTTNPAFSGISMVITSVGPGSFTVASAASGSSVGGNADVTANMAVQQVVVSTVVGGSPLQKVITKAQQ